MQKYRTTYLQLMGSMRPKETAALDSQPAEVDQSLPADEQAPGSRLDQLAGEMEEEYSTLDLQAGNQAARMAREAGKTWMEQEQARAEAISRTGQENMESLATAIEWEPEALEEAVAAGKMEDSDLDPEFDSEGNPADLSPTIYWARRARWEAQLKAAVPGSWQAQELQGKLDALEPTFAAM
jgi:hypothetical protein